MILYLVLDIVFYKKTLIQRQITFAIVSMQLFLYGGYGGNRTPVLTKHHFTFYMFISFSLVHTLLRNEQDNNDYLLYLAHYAKELTMCNPQYLKS